MKKSEKFVFTLAARIDGVASEKWVPAYGSQVAIESLAYNNGWDVRGKIDWAGGSRWYSKDDYLIYVEYGKGGRVNWANKGARGASGQTIEQVLGKNKAGQIADLLSGSYKKEVVS